MILRARNLDRAAMGLRCLGPELAQVGEMGLYGVASDSWTLELS